MFHTAALPLRGPAASRSTSQEYFDEIQDVKVTKDMLELAKHIVNQKAGTFDPEEFEDHYESALVQLINEKRAGKVIRRKERPKGENVVDLMDACARALAVRQPRQRNRSPSRSRAGQKEMLMPISGKKTAKEASRKKPAARAQRKSA